MAAHASGACPGHAVRSSCFSMRTAPVTRRISGRSWLPSRMGPPTWCSGRGSARAEPQGCPPPPCPSTSAWETGSQRFSSDGHGAPLTDLSPFRAIRRSTLLSLSFEDLSFGWPTEMIVGAARAGLRIVEVPVACRPRSGGRSKVSGTLRGTVLATAHILRVIFGSPRIAPPHAADGLEAEKTDAGDRCRGDHGEAAGAGHYEDAPVPAADARSGRRTV